MLQMFQQLGTPKLLKKSVAIPNAGDHVIGSYITSKDIPEVEKQINLFSKELKWNILSDSTTNSNQQIKILSDTSIKSDPKLKRWNKKKNVNGL